MENYFKLIDCSTLKVIKHLNCLNVVWFWMQSLSCLYAFKWFFSKVAFVLNDFKFNSISSAIVIAYKNASIPKVSNDESSIKLHLAPLNWIITANRYPIGFFELNGNLYKLKHRRTFVKISLNHLHTKKKQITFYAYHTGSDNSSALFSKPVVQ